MTILIVDDEKNIRESLKRLLEIDGYEADTADHAVPARKLLEERNYSCVLLDLRMPDIDGLELLEWIMDRGIQVPVIMMSAHGEIRDAVSALQRGARDYLVKPFDTDELMIRMKRIIDAHQLQLKVTAGALTHAALDRNAAESGAAGAPSRSFHGNSPAVVEIYRIMSKAAPTESTILITGESGTGKEVAAREIHELSSRRNGPFIPVNIAGIPESLLESELFGYEKGAFTGAERQTPGIFEAASGGTVFLDEIGEMSIPLQAKLLRVLQERRIRRVGAVHELAVDVRILAATNRNLEEMVSGGGFRQDLFYRLNVLQLELPPLRARRDDIPELTGYLLKKISGRLGRTNIVIEDRALASLCTYDFPGNIRELENILERAIILSDGPDIVMADLPGLESEGSRKHRQLMSGDSAHGGGDHAISGTVFDGSMRDIEKRAIETVLEKHDGNRTHTAEQLGISRKTLINKIKEYKLD